MSLRSRFKGNFLFESEAVVAAAVIHNINVKLFLLFEVKMSHFVFRDFNNFIFVLQAKVVTFINVDAMSFEL